MIIDVQPGVSQIDVFPGTENIALSTFDEFIDGIFYYSPIYGPKGYVPSDRFNTLTYFEPNSGVYTINALSAFQIEYN